MRNYMNIVKSVLVGCDRNYHIETGMNLAWHQAFIQIFFSVNMTQDQNLGHHKNCTCHALYSKKNKWTMPVQWGIHGPVSI